MMPLPRRRRRLAGAEDGSRVYAGTWKIRHSYGHTLCDPGTDSTKEVAEAVAIFEDVNQRVTRIYGKDHPFANASRRSLTYARLKLSALERDGVCDEGLLCAILKRTWLREEGGEPRKTRATG
tara:strand:+ start:68 stop:436 length:369 start_codon:yes stop_codon:yes gene_type:complete